MLQLPGFTNENIKLLIKHSSSSFKKQQQQQEQSFPVDSIYKLRLLPRKDAANLIQKSTPRSGGGRFSVDKVLDHLYNIPMFTIKESSIQHVVDKTSDTSIGKLNLQLEFQRDERLSQQQKQRKGKTGQDAPSSFTLLLLLGSYQQQMLLSSSESSSSSITITQKKGIWTISKEIDFDWTMANADGGEGSGQIILRLLWEEIRGFDIEILIPLKK